MNSQNNEAEIIQAAQQGDLEAFNHLIVQYQDLIFRIAVRMMMDEDLAGDAVQEACLLAFNKLASFRGGSFRNWLARIVVNVCYDELRRQRRHPSQPLEVLDADGEETPAYWLADHSANPEIRFEQRELEHTIQNCLEIIPKRYRSVLVLIDMEELSYEATAEILELPVGTVKSRLARARLHMRHALQNSGYLLPTRHTVWEPRYSKMAKA